MSLSAPLLLSRATLALLISSCRGKLSLSTLSLGLSCPFASPRYIGPSYSPLPWRLETLPLSQEGSYSGLATRSTSSQPTYPRKLYLSSQHVRAFPFRAFLLLSDCHKLPAHDSHSCDSQKNLIMASLPRFSGLSPLKKPYSSSLSEPFTAQSGVFCSLGLLTSQALPKLSQ